MKKIKYEKWNKMLKNEMIKNEILKNWKLNMKYKI